MKTRIKLSLITITVILLTFSISVFPEIFAQSVSSNNNSSLEEILAAVPEYSGAPSVCINDNVPYFADADITTVTFKSFSELDALGRCGSATACIGIDLLPTEERGEIGSVKPSGWKTIKYNSLIDGNYLYNRCHLIGYQLSGENANVCNLITGTRYLNVDGMLSYENAVANYVKKTGNHVMYRVTPLFQDSNLVASGVLMEAESVEDNGKGIQFCVYCYNVQPGIIIDYATGNSSEDPNGIPPYVSYGSSVNFGATTDTQSDMVWISRTGSKYHSTPSCSNMKNPTQITKEDAEKRGLNPCKKCY